MTYIEFFDKTASENVCACLTNPPERLILVGDKQKVLKKHAERYQELFANRGHQVEVICRSINKNNMQGIIDALSVIVETYDNCAFDLTGGDELYLVAMGIVSERFRDKQIQMHRFNLRNNTIIDCDQDGTTIVENELPEMSVEENIRIYGGDIVYDDIKPGSTVDWVYDDSFKKDIAAMWNICKSDVRLWNAQIGTFEAVETVGDVGEDELTTIASVSQAKRELRQHKAEFVYAKATINRLCAAGLLTDFECDSQTLRIAYKNSQVKRCLTKAGLALEMKIFSAAKEACDDDGKAVYNDVRNGVCIDWDGDIHMTEDEHDTENEIDVMMMRGIIPVFVSCKNGYIEMDELYKLNTVAEKFGERYAKKVLVATALDSAGEFADYFRQRAKDMNIRLIEGVQEMDNAELRRVIRSLWCN